MKKAIKSLIGKVLAVILVCTLFGSFVPATSVSAKGNPELSDTKKTIYTGETFTLKLKNVDGKITWKSSNKKVATVKDGVVTAVKAGKTTISANYKGAAYNCKVTVKAPRINCNAATLFVEGTLQLKVYGKEVKSYKSSDTKVATVSDSGKVTAVAYGEAEISATCKDGKVYYCTITVKDAYDTQIPLGDLDYFTAEQFYVNSHRPDYSYRYDFTKDNLGKEHKDYVTFSTYGYATFKVNKEYSWLTGVFYLIYDNRSNSYKSSISILGDGKELWQGTVKAGVDPISFKIDISKVKELTIEASGAYYISALGDLYLVP